MLKSSKKTIIRPFRGYFMRVVVFSMFETKEKKNRPIDAKDTLFIFYY